MGCTQSEISPEDETPRRENRKHCTDVLWLIIYIIFWIVMLIVAVVSFVYGNPLRIINGFDSFGNTCGVKKNEKFTNNPLSGIPTADKPYLLFFDIKELRRSLKVCVKQCPPNRLESFNDIKNFYSQTGSNLCRYDVDVNKVQPSRELNTYAGPCPSLPVYETFPLLNRCFPKKTKDIAEKVFTDFYNLLNSWDTVEQLLSDLYSAWKEMVICVIIAFICALIMVSILHLLATFVSWIFMIAVAVTSVVGTALLWYTWYELKTGKRDEIYAFLSETVRNERAFLWYSIVATIITIILLLLVWVMRSRVSFLAALFKETASCLGSIPTLFFQPIFTFIILVAFFAFWLLVVVCLATASYPGMPYQSAHTVNTTPIPNYSDKAGLPTDTSNAILKTFTLEPIEFSPSWVKGMWWMCLICLIWTSEFILACQQMTIAGAVSHWYFRGPNASSSPVLFSMGKLIKYHLGSVAKGSFLITLFKIPRLIMMYLHEKLRGSSDKGSDCAKCGLKCCICCFYCLEKFIKFLNHNAYTIITIERIHFCKAAGIAFNTIVSNALQVATINSVGDFILFLGKCIVTAVTGSIGLIMLKRNQQLHFFAAPLLIICIYSFFIAHCILSLYEMVVDTLFICVCEDKNINGDTGRWKESGLAQLGGGGEVRRDAVILAKTPEYEMEPLPSKEEEE